MSSLYELSQNYQALQLMLDNAEPEELEALIDTLDAIEDSIEVKAENIIKYFKNLESDAEACKAESKRLSTKAKALETKAERLKDYLNREMTAMKLNKLKAGVFTLSYRKSEALAIDDEQAISDEYKKVSYTLDKVAIKKALKDKIEVAGARLIENRNLQIR